MRTTLVLTLALFAAVEYQWYQTLPAKKPGTKPAVQDMDLELAVTTPKGEYRVGEPIPVKLAFCNRAGERTSKYEGARKWTLYLDEDHGWFCNVYVVVARQTDELDHFQINPIDPGPPSGRAARPVLVPLLPKAAWSYRWPDLRLYGDWLRKPGRYYARIYYDSTNTSRWPELKEDSSFPLWRGKLVSNTLTITVKK